MSTIPVQIGARESFAKTVSETDVYLFAGISGDFAPNHVDAQFMRSSPYGQRIAHGALAIAFMSTVAAKLAGRSMEPGAPMPVSIGYDRLRFLKPVFFGDTLVTSYEVTGAEPDREVPRSVAHVQIHNQRGELVAVATHIMGWLSTRPTKTTLLAEPQ